MLTAHIGPGVIARWAPAYEAFLALVFLLGEATPLAAKAAQVVLSTATVGLIYGLARRTGGSRAAWIAGLLATFHPGFVAYSHYLYSETLFVFLLTAAVWAFHRAPDEPRRTDLLASGLLFGLAALARSVVLYFFPLWIAWAWLRGQRAEAARATVLLAVALAVVLPWAVRNTLHYGGFMLVDPTLGRTAHLAFNYELFSRDLGFIAAGTEGRSRPRCGSPLLEDSPVLPPANELARLFPEEGAAFTRQAGGIKHLVSTARLEARTDFVFVQRCEIGRALEFIRDNLTTVTRQIATRVYAFWGPNSFLLRYVHEEVYPDGPLARSNYLAVKILVVTFHVVIVAAALLALGRSPLPPLATWSAFFTAFYTAIHALAVSYSRYRLPIMPLVIVLASLWLARPLPAGSGARWMVARLGAAVFLVLSVHYVSVILP